MRIFGALVNRTRSRRGRDDAQSVHKPEATGAPEAIVESELEALPQGRPEPAARTWNLWDLERLAEAMSRDPRAEERGLLLLHLREFADPAGDLPPEFDPLVCEAFGEDVTELVR